MVNLQERQSPVREEGGEGEQGKGMRQAVVSAVYSARTGVAGGKHMQGARAPIVQQHPLA